MYPYKKWSCESYQHSNYSPYVWHISNFKFFNLNDIKFECLLCDWHRNQSYQSSIWVLSIWFISTSEPLNHIELIHIDINARSYFHPPYETYPISPLSTGPMGQGRLAIRCSQYESCWYGTECPILICNHVNMNHMWDLFCNLMHLSVALCSFSTFCNFLQLF